MITAGATSVVLPTTSFSRFNGKGWVSIRRHIKRDPPGTASGGTLTVTWQPIDATTTFGP